jgi:hypothetical protein
MRKPTAKWRKMGEIYKRFTKDYPWADFSEAAAQEMFDHESKGSWLPFSAGTRNGFQIGKKIMDVCITGWKEDLQVGTLTRDELLADNYPEWFLTKIGI